MCSLPRVAWITPTYKRPQCLPNLIACFESQLYPREKLELIILDDAGQYGRGCRGGRWKVVSISQRIHSLPAKYNKAVWLAPLADILIVAEDDDSFTPWHTIAHVEALQAGGQYSKPSTVLSDAPGHVVEERSDGRFHGSIALTQDLWRSCVGWPDTDAANFDQVAMSHFEDAAGGVCDPCELFRPSYCFRWHTNAYHGQAQADGPGCVNWYQRAGDLQLPCARVDSIAPELDAFTQDLYRTHANADGRR